MSNCQKLYSDLQKAISKLFFETVLAYKVIVGLQIENQKVCIISGSIMAYFFSDISAKEFEKAMSDIKGAKISDAYFDSSFLVPTDLLLPKV